MTTINFLSKKVSVPILVVTALACSRVLFALFNDPEGPNLLIVVVMAVALYIASFVTVRLFAPSLSDLKKIGSVILVQILIAAILYLLLK
jgi:hypothetical protein